MSDSMREVVETLDPVSRRLIPPNIDLGTLVPLKTVLELRDNLSLGFAYVTRVPQKCTTEVLEIGKQLAGGDAAKILPHLRRCCKATELPAHLKSQFMNEANARHMHVGKSNWIYILLGPKDEIPYEDIVESLATVDAIRDDIFLAEITVPLMAPTSQIQANMWSQQFWQTVYRKNNPLGPHPASLCRTTSVVSRDASIWMALAHRIAKKSQKAGFGEPIGAVIIKRTTPGKPDAGRAPSAKENTRPSGTDTSGFDPSNGANGHANSACAPEAKLNRTESDNGMLPDISKSEHQASDPSKPDVDSKPDVNAKQDVEAKETTHIVAIAADARWHQQEKTGHTGNPMAHAALRAISMVAQKLVRAENKPRSQPQIMEFEAFQDKPILSDEQSVFEADHPCPDGYLCHELELYMTHEPCTMCAMAILHSRMGRIVFRHRMPLTGGMSSEDRGHDLCGASGVCENGPCGGGQGLGLHWRKELNWSMLGWEWEADNVEQLAVDPHMHA
ncbi:cytidine deaminase-like protein [Xylariaceae sp. FL0662B]|nr:cytidine deaminase-like protein [Xylariaceae sp. FL0662B]